MASGVKNAWKNISFDGPSPGAAHANGRLLGVRWKGGQWGARLDLHPINSGNIPILHINIGPLGRGEANHIVLFDPPLVWKERLMSNEKVVLKLREALLDLMEREPGKKEDLPEWYEMAGNVKNLISIECGDLNVPHFLWHYLDDADIRLKDARYAGMQNAQIKEFIENLKVTSKM
ncbi:MAG TPA: hypothetical protein VMR06_03735 [Dokdonella sp.]|uniref:hypothetical protein n=1 Tax=Dokdonella sp. TaxID=2291710 RepID=UPI002CE88392|nr:hypothetical protein [Dokdonella sp.]HUD41089.1 hypothetical protein [Dokdonella sp.]